ncbi:MAG: hypothetical protein HY897_10435 [Deltaproteobacteria bacterium]|nr:hypothetical protein [Deltaproteobacteria bacterium]
MNERTQATAERLLQQAALIEQSIPELDALCREAEPAAKRLAASSGDLITVMGCGGLLHGFYSALETLMRDVADSLNGGVPHGESWHARLLDHLSVDVPGVRPRLFSPDVRDRLDEFRGFRHVYRHLYVFNLKPARVLDLLTRLGPLWDELKPQLAAFAATLKEIAAGLTKDG